MKKKKYSKPNIKAVKLKAQEAVLSGCKMEGASGVGPPVDCKYHGTKCSAAGS
ncbi:MAG: hypothetical protein GTO17_05805 [Candidatus Aminicenantes bacterium]|nr:hypothetical protein [Candidatus Aminicenantes bacterium]